MDAYDAASRTSASGRKNKAIRLIDYQVLLSFDGAPDDLRKSKLERPSSRFEELNSNHRAAVSADQQTELLKSSAYREYFRVDHEPGRASMGAGAGRRAPSAPISRSESYLFRPDEANPRSAFKNGPPFSRNLMENKHMMTCAARGNYSRNKTFCTLKNTLDVHGSFAA